MAGGALANFIGNARLCGAGNCGLALTEEQKKTVAEATVKESVKVKVRRQFHLEYVNGATRRSVDKNNAERQIFYEAVVNRYGGVDKIPADVLKAMQLKDFSLKGGRVTSGRPLSDRRIGIVLAAIGRNDQEAEAIRSLTGGSRDVLLAKLGLKPTDELPARFRCALFTAAGRTDLAHEVGKMTKEMAKDSVALHRAMSSMRRNVSIAATIDGAPRPFACHVTDWLPLESGCSFRIVQGAQGEHKGRFFIAIRSANDPADAHEANHVLLPLTMLKPGEMQTRIELDLADNVDVADKAFMSGLVGKYENSGAAADRDMARTLGVKMLAAHMRVSTSVFAVCDSGLVSQLVKSVLAPNGIGRRQALGMVKAITDSRCLFNDQETLAAYERLKGERGTADAKVVIKTTRLDADEAVLEKRDSLLAFKAATEKHAAEMVKFTAAQAAADLRDAAALEKAQRDFKELTALLKDATLLKAAQNFFLNEATKDWNDVHKAQWAVWSEKGERVEELLAALRTRGGSCTLRIMDFLSWKEVPQDRFKTDPGERPDEPLPSNFNLTQADVDGMEATFKKAAEIESRRRSQKVRDLLADLVFDVGMAAEEDLSSEQKEAAKYGSVRNRQIFRALSNHAETLSLLLRGGEEQIDALDVDDAVKEALKDAAGQLRATYGDAIGSLSGNDGFNGSVIRLALDGWLNSKGEKRTALVRMLTRLGNEIDRSVEGALETLGKDFAGRLQAELGLEAGPNAAGAGQKSPKAVVDELVRQVGTEECTLENLLAKSAKDPANGYGAFISRVIGAYFTPAGQDGAGGVDLVDKRAMVASYLRSGPKKPANENDPQAMATYRGKAMGAFLKGAGPLLQKELQAMDTSQLTPELAIAIEDMKSNLAPIPDDIVKAHLLDVVNRSNGHITSIQVDESLGAASVGQAFLCTMRLDDGTSREVVVKILRPDVKTRIQRERRVFENVAKGIPGMTGTFEGRLERVLDELDLTVEARNVELGKDVYGDGTFADVNSMRLETSVAPTSNVMVLEKAPGKTLDRYAKAKAAKIKELQGPGDETFTDKASFDAYAQKLVKLHDSLMRRQDMLANLAVKWVSNGIYGSGFFHGDLHAGNMMVSKDVLTVIDFGNATSLNPQEQNAVMQMMTGAACGSVSLFAGGYKSIISRKGLELLNSDGRAAQLERMLTHVFAGTVGKKKTTCADTGSRIAVALSMMQKMGLEVPGAIFNFSEGQRRLDAAMQQIEGMIETVRKMYDDAVIRYYHTPKVNQQGGKDVVSTSIAAFIDEHPNEPQAFSLKPQRRLTNVAVNGVEYKGWFPDSIVWDRYKNYVLRNQDDMLSPYEKVLFHRGSAELYCLSSMVQGFSLAIHPSRTAELYGVMKCCRQAGLGEYSVAEALDGLEKIEKDFDDEIKADEALRDDDEQKIGVREAIDELKAALRMNPVGGEPFQKAYVRGLYTLCGHLGDIVKQKEFAQAVEEWTNRGDGGEFAAVRQLRTTAHELLEKYRQTPNEANLHALAAHIKESGKSYGLKSSQKAELKVLEDPWTPNLGFGRVEEACNALVGEFSTKIPQQIEFRAQCARASDGNFRTRLLELQKMRKLDKAPPSFVSVMGDVIKSNLGGSISRLGVLNTLANLGTIMEIGETT